ncbi:hypothetical protein GCM10023115_35140 [Pontixanthobacter gangjinensis]
MFLVLFCLLGCFSENIEITEDLRVQVSGNVSGADDLGNKEVFSFAGLENSFFSNYHKSEMLGKGRMDGAGNFEFMSLSPEYRDIQILFNSDYSENYDDDFESVFVVIESYKDKQVTLPDINIGRSAKIKLRIKNTSGIQEASYEIIYTQPGRYLVYDNGELNEFEPELLNPGRIIGDISQEIYEEEFSSLPGTEVRLLLSYGEQQEERIFTIQPGVNSYEIEF